MASHSAPSTVLIVDGDANIRDVLRLLLEAEGYAVLEKEDPNAAFAVLRALPGCIILIFSNTEPINRLALTFFTAVAADPMLVARHRYIYLTTVPEYMPPALVSVLATLSAPILAKPFDIVPLLAAVSTEAARLP